LRLQAARQAADAVDAELFINARTDVLFQAKSLAHDAAMVDQVIERARAYEDAGADGIFVPGLIEPT
jgi:2-methylisocitrate lyase-like PEP mutase family enzyme